MRRPKPYKAKSLTGAQRRVRNLLKQRSELNRLVEQYHSDRKLMAMLAADGPAFYNPLDIAHAKQRRDEILQKWCNRNPDGSPLSNGGKR